MITQHGDIPLGRGARYGTLAYDATAWSPTVQQHVWDYGIRQLVNDAIADKLGPDGEALGDADIVAKAAKRLATLASGELRVTRVSATEPHDPVERAMRRLARDACVDLVRRSDAYANAAPAPHARRMAIAVAARGYADMDAMIDRYIAVVDVAGAGGKPSKLRRAAMDAITAVADVEV